MVAREHDDGVVEDALARESGDEAAEAVVDAEQHLEAAPDLFVGRRGGLAERRHLIDLTPERRLIHR
jgi:hypothetical protein